MAALALLLLLSLASLPTHACPEDDLVLTGAVRLVGSGSPSPGEGRLQVEVGCPGNASSNQYVSGVCQWNVRSDDNWIEQPGVPPDNLPRVVCRQLGLSGGMQWEFPLSAGGVRPPPPELWTELTCNGREAGVAGCDYNGRLRNAGDCYRTANEPDNEAYMVPYEIGVICIGVVARNDLEVRLAGGPSAREGRVEVRLGGSSGKWGPVCNRDLFNSAAAKVVCRQLGFKGPVAVRSSSFYGSTSAPPALEIGRCVGSEGGLHACAVTTLPHPTECKQRDLGVWCGGSRTVEKVRLAGGLTALDGVVQVRLGGRWGSICPARGSGPDIARVVCRQLNLTGGRLIKVSYGRPGSFGPRSIAQVSCTSSEASLSECALTGTGPPCDDWDLSGNPQARFAVACDGPAGFQPAPLVRLAGGQPNEGRLEFYQQGSWRPVFSGGPVSLAWAACQRLGFQGGAVRHHFSYGNTTAPPLAAFLYDDLYQSCGSDSGTSLLHILACSADYVDFWEEVPSSSYYGMACSGAQTIRALRLAGSGVPQEGRLEVQLGASWGPVAMSGTWFVGSVSYEPRLSGLARVACRQLGYAGGVLRLQHFYGKGRLPVAMYDPSCTGKEASLNDCSLSLEKHDADDPWDPTIIAGVACEGSKTLSQVRLVGGPTNREGRLEALLHDDSWTAVDADLLLWSGKGEVARVACRQLGFGGGRWRGSNELYGRGSLPLKVKALGCKGTETSLSQCVFGQYDVPWEAPYDASAVGIACSGSRTVTGVRLMKGNKPSTDGQGRLEVKIAGKGWGGVCRFNVNPATAATACRQLGFEGGSQPAYNNNYSPEGPTVTRWGTTSLPIFLFDLQCPIKGGSSLEDCGFFFNTAACQPPDFLELSCR